MPPFFYSEELFYQLGLHQFGDFSRIKLEPPPSLRSLLEITVEADESTVKSQLTKTEIVDVCSYIMTRSSRYLTYVYLPSITHRKASPRPTRNAGRLLFDDDFGTRHAGEHPAALEGT